MLASEAAGLPDPMASHMRSLVRGQTTLPIFTVPASEVSHWCNRGSISLKGFGFCELWGRRFSWASLGCSHDQVVSCFPQRVRRLFCSSWVLHLAQRRGGSPAVRSSWPFGEHVLAGTDSRGVAESAGQCFSLCWPFWRHQENASVHSSRYRNDSGNRRGQGS